MLLSVVTGVFALSGCNLFSAGATPTARTVSSTCTVSATTGCVTFHRLTLISPTTGATVTLSGKVSFLGRCSPTLPTTGCSDALPNAFAAGRGRYVLRSRKGQLISQGRYRVANTSRMAEGLFAVSFLNRSHAPVNCSTAVMREVDVDATLIDARTGRVQLAQISIQTSNLPHAASRAFVNSAGDYFQVAIPPSTLVCNRSSGGTGTSVAAASTRRTS